MYVHIFTVIILGSHYAKHCVACLIVLFKVTCVANGCGRNNVMICENVWI